MNLNFKRKNKPTVKSTDFLTPPPVTNAPHTDSNFFSVCSSDRPDSLPSQRKIYHRIRCEVPVVDAAVSKIIRLTGGFQVKACDETCQQLLDDFVNNVPVNLTGISLGSFLEGYLDSLLTYGSAVGEILTDKDTGEICALANFTGENFHVKQGQNPSQRVYCVSNGRKEKILPNPERILFTALNPTPENPEGRSILKGLPPLCEILLKIYRSIGKNFDRVGNVRYAVTYKPSNESDYAFSKERATAIAREWSSAMHSSADGIVKDFVAVGDIDIKVIGAENQLIDAEIPTRLLLEQILSKLSVPPFLLGLNWTSTERMSSQQVDILTSELEYYRRLLNPVIRKITSDYLSSHGCDNRVEILWDNINLQDEAELAKARLNNAQAHAIELENSQE